MAEPAPVVPPRRSASWPACGLDGQAGRLIIETPIKANFREGSPERSGTHLHPRRPSACGHRAGRPRTGLPGPVAWSTDPGPGGWSRTIAAPKAPDHGARWSKAVMSSKSLRDRGWVVAVVVAEVVHPETKQVVIPATPMLDEDSGWMSSKRLASTRSRCALTMIAETRFWRLRDALRPRPGPAATGQHRRGGGRDRGAVDRRAGHAADHAYLPHGGAASVRRWRPASTRSPPVPSAQQRCWKKVTNGRAAWRWCRARRNRHADHGRERERWAKCRTARADPVKRRQPRGQGRPPSRTGIRTPTRSSPSRRFRASSNVDGR